ncbi:MAG: ribonuclease D, partial [Micromonosporaceae bacterium]
MALTTPREGTPAPIETSEALEYAVKRLAAGSGPLAVDAERASGYRYSHRAYLIQLRRAGAGTFLIDPVTFDSLAGLSNELRDTEWVLHAASQDLP